MTTFSRTPVELPVAAERDGALPLAGQISGQLRAALADGRLAAGERLPSSRALAASLGVSRTVVTTALKLRELFVIPSLNESATL